MLITDSQVLIWGPETKSRPWPTAFRKVYPEPFGADEVVRRMDAAGVDSAVLVTPGWELGKNDVTVAAAARFPRRFVVVGCVDPAAEPDEQVRALRREPAIRGMRLNFNQPALRGMLHDDRAERLIRAAQEAALPVMVFAPGEVDALERLIASCPGTSFMIDHVNVDKGTAARHLEESVERTFRFSRYENVAIKVSALPCFTSEEYPFERAAATLLRVVSEFGADRCMWGSDLHRLPCPYAEWVNAVLSLKALTEQQKEQVMGLTARRVLGWPQPVSQLQSSEAPGNEH